MSIVGSTVLIVGCGGGDSGGGGGTSAATQNGTVTGQVTSAANNAAVAGATVSTGAGSTTSAPDGSFTVAAGAGERTVVHVDAIGFAEAFPVSRVVAGQTTNLGVRLLTDWCEQPSHSRKWGHRDGPEFLCAGQYSRERTGSEVGNGDGRHGQCGGHANQSSGRCHSDAGGLPRRVSGWRICRADRKLWRHARRHSRHEWDALQLGAGEEFSDSHSGWDPLQFSAGHGAPLLF